MQRVSRLDRLYYIHIHVYTHVHVQTSSLLMRANTLEIEIADLSSPRISYIHIHVHVIYPHRTSTVGGLQAFPPVNIAPDINMDLAPPVAKKVRSEADDLVPEQQFIAGHPVRNTDRWMKSLVISFPLRNVCDVYLVSSSAHG